MTPLQRLLLIPCLSPLLLTLLVGGLNFGKAGNLRILTWELPALPIGVWMVLAATSGAALGSGGVLAAGLSGTQQTLQREVRRPFTWPEEPANQNSERSASSAASMPWPERDIRDPAPTVSVPFRVIRTGRDLNEPTAQTNPDKKVETEPTQTPTRGVDDWHHPISTEWENW